jgi:glutamate-1-semialdehyde 2,1-aminomutase
LSGNPITMAAGLATLRELEKPGCYDRLRAMTEQLIEGILARAASFGIAFQANYLCGMFGFFFTNEAEVTRYAQVMSCNSAQFNPFFHAMLGAGVYLAPSAFEAGFVSMAHGPTEINQTLLAFEQAFSYLTKL